MNNSLREFNFKNIYESSINDPFEEFLIPALNRSKLYSRAVGYFSSAILGIMPQAFTQFAENGGKIRIICSPHLTPRDAEFLTSWSKQEVVQNLNEQIKFYVQDGLINEPINLLKSLFKLQALEIKFATPNNPGSGIFHQKLGIFEDHIGNFITFQGSNNESVNGWLEMRNSEKFNIARGWATDEYQKDISHSEKSAFEKMWRNNYPGWEIEDYSKKLELVTDGSPEDRDFEQVKKAAINWVEKRRNKTQESNALRHYQSSVIENWKKNDHTGIVSFATGAGKTFTALNASKYWIESGDKRALVIIVPSEVLQKQWIKEIRKIKFFEKSSILTVGGGSGSDSWLEALSSATSFSKSENPRIVVAVKDSASSDKFINRVSWGNQLMVIADEMHSLGAPSYLKLLENINVGAIMGLSATPERYDDEQNLNLKKVFGSELKPVIDIGAAIDEEILVPYRYRYKPVKLEEDEFEKYTELSDKISKLYAIARSKNENIENSHLENLKFQRADVLKNARNKIKVVKDLILKEYKEGSSWVIFCNDESQLTEIKNSISDLKPLSFYQNMQGDRKATLKFFENQGGILLSIDMLTEGVDIPSIDTGLLVASSKSKREYIQRRGRVLRRNPNKPKAFAEIWDLLVVDKNNKIVDSDELDRALEFIKFSLNRTMSIELEKLR